MDPHILHNKGRDQDYFELIIFLRTLPGLFWEVHDAITRPIPDGSISMEGLGFTEREQHKNKLLTISEVAVYLNMKVKTIYAKVEAGEIPHYHIGRLVRFRLAEIDAWLADCRSNNQPASEQHKPRNRRRKSSKHSMDHFSKMITKTIDEETERYYSANNGKSDRITGPKQEVQNGSL